MGEREWQGRAPTGNEKRRVGRTRTLCASHKCQEVNEQEGRASERTSDKQQMTTNEITWGPRKQLLIKQD